MLPKIVIKTPKKKLIYSLNILLELKIYIYFYIFIKCLSSILFILRTQELKLMLIIF